MSNTATPPAINSTLTGDAARTRSTDPDTSHEAADSNGYLLALSQREVLWLLERHGPLPDYVLERLHAEHWDAMGMAPASRFTGQRLRTARQELVELGLVEATGAKVPVVKHGAKRRTKTKVWRIRTATTEEAARA